MATNGEIPAGDTEMAECDGEEIVTMMDVLKEQQDFEDDANAVLGGSDEKECTYSQGYIKRQAIYACMTCCPESKDDPSKRAGFCLACSLTCHENHDLIELYTKRNFRCDCGNPKFKSPCQFTPSKTDLNDENVYNQNFVGLYCSCSKPYGDQESTLDDEMIQCVVCEDWWHATHLDAVVPAHDLYSEMVCKLCMAKNEFLHDYSDLVVNVETDVDVIDNRENDDKLTNGSLFDEKLTNTTANYIEESSANMETSTTEVTPVSNNKDILSSTEKATIDSDEAGNETVELEKPVVNNENESNASMDTDETDKASEVVPEVSSVDKLESTVDKSDDNEPFKDKGEETASKEKAEETSETSDDKTEESNDTSIEKTDVSVAFADNSESTDKTTEVKEEDNNTESTKMADQSETSVDNNVSSTQIDSAPIEKVSEDTKKSSENVEAIERKVTEDQEIDAEKEKADQVNAEPESPSAETDKPIAETNENTTNEAKPVETSQDVEMNGIDKKDNEVVTEDSSKDTSKVDEPANGELKDSNSTNEVESVSNETVPELASIENKRKIDEDVTDDVLFKKPKLDKKCLRPKGVRKVHKGATFWPTTLRQRLCTCSECISMYKDLCVLFLTDSEDTVLAYETLGKERTAGKPNQYEKGMEALCSLGRIQQIDALTEYNKMRDKLLTFLQSFKDKKEIVTEDAIKTFFAGMKPEKRMDGVYFCG